MRRERWLHLRRHSYTFTPEETLGRTRSHSVALGRTRSHSEGTQRVIKGPSECHQNLIRGPSECHQRVIRGSSECHQNVIQMSSEGTQRVIRGSSECHQRVIRGSSEGTERLSPHRRAPQSDPLRAAAPLRKSPAPRSLFHSAGAPSRARAGLPQTRALAVQHGRAERRWVHASHADRT